MQLKQSFKQNFTQNIQVPFSISPEATETSKRLTMDNIQSLFEVRQKQLEEKALFQALSNSANINDLRAIAPHFYFFIPAFQDMLRLTHKLIRDSALKDVALSLVQEDAGHEQWYFFDVEELNCVRDVRWIFSSIHQPIRDLVYDLIHELFSASNDQVRIIFPLILESTGKVFFKHLVGLAQRSGYDLSLRYFATHHQQAEINHSFYHEHQGILNNLEFAQTTSQEVIALIHNCFNSFDYLAEHLEKHRGDWTDD